MCISKFNQGWEKSLLQEADFKHIYARTVAFGKGQLNVKSVTKNEKLFNIQQLQFACWYTLYLIMYFTIISEKNFIKHLQNLFSTLATTWF